VLTITSAVLLAYVVLFVLVLLTAVVFVPSTYFQSTLKHPVGPADYATLVWLGNSLATVAGAIESSLEHEDTVREIAYGYRQGHRNETGRVRGRLWRKVTLRGPPFPAPPEARYLYG
jgi:hypothetical protein